MPVWAKRLDRISDESFEFLRRSHDHLRNKVAIRAVPSRDGTHQFTYRYGVRGEPVPYDLVEDLGDLFGRARSVLDIAMKATAKEIVGLNPSQLRGTYFPISTSEKAWQSAAGQAHLKLVPAAKKEALRKMQPYVTGDQTMYWFAELNNGNKHDLPVALKAIVDPEFVMGFENVRPKMGTSEWWVDWVDPLPAVENRVPFVTYRTAEPIDSADHEAVPLAIAVWFDGGWKDIQHMLWGVMEFVHRACAVLNDTDTDVADVMRDYFGAERAQLAAFKAMMELRTPLASPSQKAAEAEWQRLSELTRAAADRFAEKLGSHPPGHGNVLRFGSAFLADPV